MLLFNQVMAAVGLEAGEEDALGAGIASGSELGFVQGVFRDENDAFVAGIAHADRVRAIDLILAPGTARQRAALLGAVRPN